MTGSTPAEVMEAWDVGTYDRSVVDSYQALFYPVTGIDQSSPERIKNVKIELATSSDFMLLDSLYFENLCQVGANAPSGAVAVDGQGGATTEFLSAFAIVKFSEGVAECQIERIILQANGTNIGEIDNYLLTSLFTALISYHDEFQAAQEGWYFSCSGYRAPWPASGSGSGATGGLTAATAVQVDSTFGAFTGNQVRGYQFSDFVVNNFFVYGPSSTAGISSGDHVLRTPPTIAGNPNNTTLPDATTIVNPSGSPYVLSGLIDPATTQRLRLAMNGMMFTGVPSAGSGVTADYLHNYFAGAADYQLAATGSYDPSLATTFDPVASTANYPQGHTQTNPLSHPFIVVWRPDFGILQLKRLLFPGTFLRFDIYRSPSNYSLYSNTTGFVSGTAIPYSVYWRQVRVYATYVRYNEDTTRQLESAWAARVPSANIGGPVPYRTSRVRAILCDNLLKGTTTNDALNKYTGPRPTMCAVGFVNSSTIGGGTTFQNSCALRTFADIQTVGQNTYVAIRNMFEISQLWIDVNGKQYPSGQPYGECFSRAPCQNIHRKNAAGTNVVSTSIASGLAVQEDSRVFEAYLQACGKAHGNINTLLQPTAIKHRPSFAFGYPVWVFMLDPSGARSPAQDAAVPSGDCTISIHTRFLDQIPTNITMVLWVVYGVDITNANNGQWSTSNL